MDGPCDLVEDKWFAFKASEFSGSYRRWDEISETYLRVLPLLARDIGNRVPDDPDGYYITIPVEPPLVLTYRVVETTTTCEVVFINLRMKLPF